MSRPTRTEILMESAWLWARRSTCDRLQVGAVFARDGRILVTGYNGSPAGIPHCRHDICSCEQGIGMHSSMCTTRAACTISEHAERNGIAYAARHGVRLEGAELFVTHMPCLPCSMSVINAGVVRVTYQETYRDTSGIELLRQAKVSVDHYFHQMVE